jgi:hypothetical protein
MGGVGQNTVGLGMVSVQMIGELGHWMITRDGTHVSEQMIGELGHWMITRDGTHVSEQMIGEVGHPTTLVHPAGVVTHGTHAEWMTVRVGQTPQAEMTSVQTGRGSVCLHCGGAVQMNVGITVVVGWTAAAPAAGEAAAAARLALVIAPCRNDASTLCVVVCTTSIDASALTYTAVGLFSSAASVCSVWTTADFGIS